MIEIEHRTLQDLLDDAQYPFQPQDRIPFFCVVRLGGPCAGCCGRHPQAILEREIESVADDDLKFLAADYRDRGFLVRTLTNEEVRRLPKTRYVTPLWGYELIDLRGARAVTQVFVAERIPHTLH